MENDYIFDGFAFPTPELWLEFYEVIDHASKEVVDCES